VIKLDPQHRAGPRLPRQCQLSSTQCSPKPNAPGAAVLGRRYRVRAPPPRDSQIDWAPLWGQGWLFRPPRSATSNVFLLRTWSCPRSKKPAYERRPAHRLRLSANAGRSPRTTKGHAGKRLSRPTWRTNACTCPSRQSCWRPSNKVRLLSTNPPDGRYRHLAATGRVHRGIRTENASDARRRDPWRPAVTTRRTRWTNEWTVIVLGTHFAGGLFRERPGRAQAAEDEADVRLPSSPTDPGNWSSKPAQPLLHRLLPA